MSWCWALDQIDPYFANLQPSFNYSALFCYYYTSYYFCIVLLLYFATLWWIDPYFANLHNAFAILHYSNLLLLYIIVFCTVIFSFCYPLMFWSILQLFILNPILPCHSILLLYFSILIQTLLISKSASATSCTLLCYSIKLCHWFPLSRQSTPITSQSHVHIARTQRKEQTNLNQLWPGPWDNGWGGLPSSSTLNLSV